MIVGASREARPARLNEPTSWGVSLCLVFLSACTTYNHEPSLGIAIQTGRMENAEIREASGLAQSNRQAGRLWTMNDGGSPPILYALAHDGTEQGSVRLSGAKNVDWEDLASFEMDGEPWLLVADVGDNFGRRAHVTLYVVAEPKLAQHEATPSRQIDFRYPDGPQDAEAVAVDANEQLVYVLSKRSNPVKLYSLPLNTVSMADGDLLTATYLGTVGSLPQPTKEDQDQALARKSWHWQTTAMDFSNDGKTAVILTYRAAYLYYRQDGESWLEALQQSPVTFGLGSIKEAEAACLSNDNVFITVEARNAPIYRIEYEY